MIASSNPLIDSSFDDDPEGGVQTARTQLFALAGQDSKAFAAGVVVSTPKSVAEVS